MARKRARSPAAISESSLHSRTRKALFESRFSEALDLAKKLVAVAASEANAELLRETYLAMISQLLENETSAAAVGLLDQAEKQDGPASWWEALALARARLGDLPKAKLLLQRAPDSTLFPRVLCFIVDRAMADRQRGRDLVPGDLQAGFDLIRRAFAEYDRGESEPARQTLQAIGLQSPFLEWKILIRGLIAYSANDDPRALDNWSRLDAERLPARLAAPLRYSIDPAFRSALPADQAARIARRADRLAHPALAQLRELQALLGSPDNLSRALRKAAGVLGMLKTIYPQAVPQLANCFYWLILHGGSPETLNLFHQVFGGIADDKNSYRLKALVMERIGQFENANSCWKKYLAEIDSSRSSWPEVQLARAQAMIFNRMGENICEAREPDVDSIFDEMLLSLRRGRLPAVPDTKALTQSAQASFLQAIDRAPDWRPPYEHLIDLLIEEEKWDEIEPVARRFLEHSPDDVAMLLCLSNAQAARLDIVGAMESLQRAHRSNPLDRSIRNAIAKFQLLQCHALLDHGKFEEACRECAKIIENSGDLPALIARAIWAACEYKIEETVKAEKLINDLNADPTNRAAVSYMLLVESTRAKLAKKVLGAQQQCFEQALSARLNGPELQMLVETLVYFDSEPKKYRGFHAHQKKIAGALLTAIEAEPAETELIQMGYLALKGRLAKVLRACVDQGKSRFPDSPDFYYLEGEQIILQKPRSFRLSDAGSAFVDALDILEERQDERNQAIRDAIALRRGEYPDLDFWMKREEDFGDYLPF